jgi:hypothetical protein
MVLNDIKTKKYHKNTRTHKNIKYKKNSIVFHRIHRFSTDLTYFFHRLVENTKTIKNN